MSRAGKTAPVSGGVADAASVSGGAAKAAPASGGAPEAVFASPDSFLVCGEGSGELVSLYGRAFQAAQVPLTVVEGSSSWDQARTALLADGCAGGVVTGDLRYEAYEQVDITAASAKLSGGVSMILCRKGKMAGFNTAGSGLVRALSQLQVPMAGSAAIVGTGCGAASCVSALAQAGVSRIVMLSPEKQRAQQVMDRVLREFGDLSARQMGMPSVFEGQLSFRQAYERASFQFGTLDISEPSPKAGMVVWEEPEGLKVTVGSLAYDTSQLLFGQVFEDAQTVAGAVCRHVSPDVELVRRACSAAV